MTKPKFNNSFSVEDIHELRNYNYETTKDLSKDELIKDINDKADLIRERIETIRQQKLAI